MSSQSKYWLFQARFGIVLAIGLVLALGVLASGEQMTAIVVAAATVAVAVVVYLTVDRRRARGLSRAD
ncbi:MAG: hypothetical protein ABWZ98_17100 [Nakamurella sp.]